MGGGGLGVVGIIIYLAFALLGGGTNLGTLGPLDGTSVSQGSPSQVLGQECQTGADANAREDCRIVGDINSIQKYWRGEVAGYVPATTVFFTGSINTGCGQADTAVGPFYCPADQHVHTHLGHFAHLTT